MDLKARTSEQRSQWHSTKAAFLKACSRGESNKADHLFLWLWDNVPAVEAFDLLLSTLFITTNLSIGYTFSTIVQNQLQAMQLSMMFFLPSILLSGFMFPFAGMPIWAQYVGEGLPLTHYLRIVRAIMLKGSSLQNLQYDSIALLALMLLAMTIAVTRFRRTLD